MYRFLSAVGLNDKVETGRLRRFILELFQDPELSRSAYVRSGSGAMFVEKRKNMGPFFVTLFERAAGGTHELTEVIPGVRETWGRMLTDVSIAEDGEGHFFAVGADASCGEPISLMLTSAANLFNDQGRLSLEGEKRFPAMRSHGRARSSWAAASTRRASAPCARMPSGAKSCPNAPAAVSRAHWRSWTAT